MRLRLSEWGRWVGIKSLIVAYDRLGRRARGILAHHDVDHSVALFSDPAVRTERDHITHYESTFRRIQSYADKLLLEEQHVQ